VNITKKYLDEAIKLVGGQRHIDYGDKVDNHNNIAKLWSSYLDVNITAHDVAIMMCLLKIARTKLGKPTADTYIDASAYMSIAGECKEREKNENKN
jgi:hypothetical protein|tara:strand:+ start:1094 stop:1381 length:288 start_codon:yes stop_codon:yes gene_type:complete